MNNIRSNDFCLSMPEMIKTAIRVFFIKGRYLFLALIILHPEVIFLIKDQPIFHFKALANKYSNLSVDTYIILPSLKEDLSGIATARFNCVNKVNIANHDCDHFQYSFQYEKVKDYSGIKFPLQKKSPTVMSMIYSPKEELKDLSINYINPIKKTDSKLIYGNETFKDLGLYAWTFWAKKLCDSIFVFLSVITLICGPDFVPRIYNFSKKIKE